MTLTNFYYLNETGSKKNQEDFIWPAPGLANRTSKIFIVCDGVGGSSKGEVASRMVAEYMGQALSKTDLSVVSIEMVNELLALARNALSDYARAANAGNDMATTFTLLILYTDKAFIAWCGDSRVYHFREGKIIYKTEDHSLVNSLVKSGEISETDASVHPQKNIILKAIKADSPLIEAEGGWTSAVQNGDYFLLCTDGLLENWNDHELIALLVKNDANQCDLAEAINKKCFNHTRDNYSMYLVQTTASDEKMQTKKGRKSGFLFFILLFVIMIITGIIYGLNQEKNSPVVINPAALKKDSTAYTAPVEKDTLAKQPADTFQAPVRVEITNPEKEPTLLKPVRDTVQKKPVAKIKKHLTADSVNTLQKSAIPKTAKKDTADLIHQ